MGVAEPGMYHELLNTDSAIYAGSSACNAVGLQAEETPWHNQPWSVVVTLPPLGAVYFEKA